MARTSSGLTKKQQLFWEEFCRNGQNGAEAYRFAYNTKASPQVCATEAKKLLKHPQIALLRQKVNEQAIAAVKKANDRYAITKARVLSELALLGYSNQLDYIRIGENGDPYFDLSGLSREHAAAIGEITIEEFKDGGGEDARDVRRIKFKLADKRAALESIAKIAGFVVDRKEVKIRDLRDLTDEELDEIIAREDGRQE